MAAATSQLERRGEPRRRSTAAAASAASAASVQRARSGRSTRRQRPGLDDRPRAARRRRPRRAAGRRGCARSSAACAGRRRLERPSATSTVRLPSRRSSPAGLPVSAGSPKTPSTSSRSWNASPSGRPYAAYAASSVRRRAGQRGAEVQRPLDRVLRALVADDPAGPLDRAAAAWPARAGRGTGRPSARCASGRRPAAPRSERRRRQRRLGAASRRPRPGTGRRAGSPRRSPNASGDAAPAVAAVQRGEAPVHGGLPAAGVASRPSRRRGSARRPGAARARRPRSTIAGRRRRRRRRASPSSRTPGAAACRRRAGR